MFLNFLDEMRAAGIPASLKEHLMLLEALDRDNAQWDARVQAYLQARASILADAALSQAMKQQKIEAMLQAGFNGTEQPMYSIKKTTWP